MEGQKWEGLDNDGNILHDEPDRSMRPQIDALQAQIEAVRRERDEQIANSLVPFQVGDWIRVKWFNDEMDGVVTGHKRGAVLFANRTVGEGFIELQNIVAHVSKQQQADLTRLREALDRLNKAVSPDVKRIFAKWVDEYPFREPQLTELREALLQTDAALTPAAGGGNK